MEKEAKLRLGRKEMKVGGSRKRKRTQKARRNRGEYTCLYPVERYTSQDREWRGEVGTKLFSEVSLKPAKLFHLRTHPEVS